MRIIKTVINSDKQTFRLYIGKTVDSLYQHRKFFFVEWKFSTCLCKKQRIVYTIRCFLVQIINRIPVKSVFSGLNYEPPDNPQNSCTPLYAEPA